MEQDELIERWQRAGLRAQEEQVRVIDVGGEYRATSSSRPLGSYLLRRSPDGWLCECRANSEYGIPCKHLWALSEVLGLDLLTDIHLAPELLGASQPAA